MAPTIRIKREDAIKALEEKLQKTVQENRDLQDKQSQYAKDKAQYNKEVTKLAKRLIQAGSVISLQTRLAGEYCSDLGSRLQKPSVVVVLETTTDDLPPRLEKPEGRTKDTAPIEQQLRLLKMATDDTVPVSLFKDLQDLL